MESQGVLFDSQTTRETVFGTSKDLGHVLRIAGCIHVLNNTLVVREEVDIDSMRSAHELYKTLMKQKAIILEVSNNSIKYVIYVSFSDILVYLSILYYYLFVISYIYSFFQEVYIK